MDTFPFHENKPQWQHDQCNQLIANLPLKACVCVHDFNNPLIVHECMYVINYVPTHNTINTLT
ncbi:hypothetical protein MAR_021703 [Mya arenaria]|uniref:Uncharacterized protein n=1 Tax=Mya arenaria TaxID=6604 RepID=A0ABY7ED66_MYAAR|nr:hypothetical protein MAR_021703 [Mya arenaria]